MPKQPIKPISDKVHERIILVMFIVVSIFLLTISLAVGQVVMGDVDVPSSISENDSYEISFNAVSNITEDINYRIYLDGALVSEESKYVLVTNYSGSGSHLLTLSANDTETSESDDYWIYVEDVPLTVTLQSPSNVTYSNRSVYIGASVSTYADSCVYGVTDISGSSGYLAGELAGDGKHFNALLNLAQDGQYLLEVNCSNPYDASSASVYFSIDTAHPAILTKSAVVGDDNTVTFTLLTDRVCSCKYDLADRIYDDMAATFLTTNNVQHFTAINGLPDGSYKYYIRCKSTGSAITGAESVSFSILTKPSAAISLSESPPLKSGTYEVTLTANKPLSSAPSLYYTFNSDSTARYVILTGSGTVWKGYLIIDEDTPNMVGAFQYSGVDLGNNVGNIITSGKLFLVDTTRPEAPESANIESQSEGYILLKWYYDGEDADRFNIYRSTDGDPDYVDYYDSTTTKQYVDNDVIDGVTYYYKIAAVDDAGNDGVLSDTMSETSRANIVVNSDNTVTVQESLDNNLVPKVDQLVSELTDYLNDIDVAKSELDDITDVNTLKIITLMNLPGNVDAAKSEIETLIGQTSDLKSKNVGSSELDMALNKFRMDAIKAKSQVAEEIVLSDYAEYDQVTQESDVANAISEAVQVNLSKNVLSEYSDANMLLQDNITVRTEILIFKIKYLGKDDYDKYTIVKKAVASSQELDDVSIIEVIPKSFESKASDIVFNFQDQDLPAVVNEDPVLRWDVAALGKYTIYYLIHGNAEMSSAKETRTVVLDRPDFKVTQTAVSDDSGSSDAGMLTGFLSLGDAGLRHIKDVSLIQWLVIIGAGMVLGLSAYYIALEQGEKKRNAQGLKAHKIISVISKPSQLKPVSRISNPVASVKRNTAITSNNAVTSSVQEKTKIQQAGSGYKADDPVDSVTFGQRLEYANTLINDFDYENARTIYNDCMKRLDKLKFKNGSDRDGLKMLLNHLHLKLTVYRAIYYSRSHISARSYPVLKQDIELIGKIYAKLYSALENVDDDHKDSERKFIDYVANSKRHLESLMS